MYLLTTLANLRLLDILDICLLTILVYHLYLWFRKTKTVKALIGLLGLVIIYISARGLGLFLTTWALQVLFQVVVILLIVIFQAEIRQVLERINPLQVFGVGKHSTQGRWIEQFSEAISALAERRTGALAVLEQTDNAMEFLTEGQLLEGEPGFELLMTVFQKESPLHDGAVLVRSGRVIRAACYLPLSYRQGLPKRWGTRHRAALGLSEKSDAVIVVVSEETGRISLARDSEMTSVPDPGKLPEKLSEIMTASAPEQRSWLKKVLYLITDQWPAKGGTWLLVVALWVTLAGQQDFETTVTVPLGMKNFPQEYEIVDPAEPEIEIKVRGLRKDAGAMEEEDLTVEIDMALVRLGRRTFSITRDNVQLANDRINVVSIKPTKIKFNLRERK